MNPRASSSTINSQERPDPYEDKFSPCSLVQRPCRRPAFRWALRGCATPQLIKGGPPATPATPGRTASGPKQRCYVPREQLGLFGGHRNTRISVSKNESLDDKISLFKPLPSAVEPSSRPNVPQTSSSVTVSFLLQMPMKIPTPRAMSKTLKMLVPGAPPRTPRPRPGCERRSQSLAAPRRQGSVSRPA